MSSGKDSGTGLASSSLSVTELPAAGGALVGVACLDAPKSLNALTLPMVGALYRQLLAWATDPRIACVVLHGAGSRAFCAGGDIRSLRQAAIDCGQRLPNPAATAFFASEYRLDYLIHTYPRPLVVWGNGLVFGGGMGLMAGASHRVVTASSQLAMPEISIGLYPDVGAGWWLQRLPGPLGLFLGLTGVALDASQALEVGLADTLLAEDSLAMLLQALQGVHWQRAAQADRAVVTGLLRDLAVKCEGTGGTQQGRLPVSAIEAMLADDDLDRGYAAITGYAGSDPWLQRAASNLRRGSPTSAALIWRHWQHCHGRTLAEVLRLELTLSLQCCAHPDFAEGVRALLLDRDQAPKWQPATLAAVSPEWIQAHFEPAALPDDCLPLTDPGWPASPPFSGSQR